MTVARAFIKVSAIVFRGRQLRTPRCAHILAAHLEPEATTAYLTVAYPIPCPSADKQSDKHQDPQLHTLSQSKLTIPDLKGESRELESVRKMGSLLPATSIGSLCSHRAVRGSYSRAPTWYKPVAGMYAYPYAPFQGGVGAWSRHERSTISPNAPPLSPPSCETPLDHASPSAPQTALSKLGTYISLQS
ncbi:MAG: hypothetical protein KatS3mg017_0637 [Fimbriimonadales bacterium]|nr:MAG: hypothetical protein KatS3mg017_0637 [Fimbriimonadales bacterium]